LIRAAEATMKMPSKLMMTRSVPNAS
jgi:hypothetical protein